tara:strand:+ start:454 stop:657 length:204 start_codon:yes stop_codon:yes gene_type:complete
LSLLIKVISKEQLKIIKKSNIDIEIVLNENNIVFVFPCGHLPILDSNSKNCAGCLTEKHFKLMDKMG